MLLMLSCRMMKKSSVKTAPKGRMPPIAHLSNFRVETSSETRLVTGPGQYQGRSVKSGCMNQACAGICLHGQLLITSAPSLLLINFGCSVGKVVNVPAELAACAGVSWHGFRDCCVTLASKRGFQHDGAATKMERSTQAGRCALSRGTLLQGLQVLRFPGLFYRVCLDPSASWLQLAKWRSVKLHQGYPRIRDSTTLILSVGTKPLPSRRIHSMSQHHESLRSLNPAIGRNSEMHARQCIIPETCLHCIVSQANREKATFFCSRRALACEFTARSLVL